MVSCTVPTHPSDKPLHIPWGKRGQFSFHPKFVCVPFSLLFSVLRLCYPSPDACTSAINKPLVILLSNIFDVVTMNIISLGWFQSCSFSISDYCSTKIFLCFVSRQPSGLKKWITMHKRFSDWGYIAEKAATLRAMMCKGKQNSSRRLLNRGRWLPVTWDTDVVLKAIGYSQSEWQDGWNRRNNTRTTCIRKRSTTNNNKIIS